MFNHGRLENAAGRELTRFILADRKDIEETYDGPNCYILMENYDYFILTKEIKNNMPKPKSYASITTDVKQMISHIFLKIYQEIKNISDDDLKQIDSITLTTNEERQISEKFRDPKDREKERNDIKIVKKMHFLATKAAEENEDSYIRFIMDYVDSVSIDPNSFLADAHDPSEYFATKIKQAVKNDYNGPKSIPIILSEMFTRFMKCLGKDISRFIWYKYGTINIGFFKAILHTRDISFDMICDLESIIRPKEKKTTTPKTKNTPAKKAPQMPKKQKEESRHPTIEKDSEEENSEHGEESDEEDSE